MTKLILLEEIEKYYTEKLNRFGCTPRGVDWNGIASQETRFLQLCKIINRDSDFSINDLGCGYGALFDYILKQNYDCKYRGIDVSDAMITNANIRHRAYLNASYVCAAEPSEPADFGIASGVFNVRLSASEEQWSGYFHATLDILNTTSLRGFAFNCLTSYSDKHLMQDNLYYMEPSVVFDYCKKRYSRNVALLHDYDLYEFTILVRK